jgi:integrase
VGIRKRGKKWYVDVSDGRGRRIRRSVGTSKAVAEMVAKDLDVKIARAEFLGIFESNSVPFSEYAASWLARKKETVSHATYGDYASIMKVYALPHFGAIPLCKVSQRDVEDFLEKLGTLSAKRKNNIMVPVKNLFNDARRRGEIKESPCEMIRRFKEGKTFIDPLSFAEIKLFLEHVDPFYVPYFSTAFLTGMRPNEMLALKWLHVDFDMKCITVREGRVQGIEGPPKTLSSFRDIDLLDPLYSLLQKHRAAAIGATYVFTGKLGGPLQVDNLRNKVWYPALQAAKLRKRTMYQTRHTFASLMLSHGEDPLWVARMLGHTTLDMIFRHYGKFIRNRARKDGTRFLAGMEEAQVATALIPVKAIPEATCEELNHDSRHRFGTVVDIHRAAKKRGHATTRNP